MDQQDAFELYMLLVDTLIESALKKDGSKDKSKTVGSVFGFVGLSRL